MFDAAYAPFIQDPALPKSIFEIEVGVCVCVCVCVLCVYVAEKGERGDDRPLFHFYRMYDIHPLTDTYTHTHTHTHMYTGCLGMCD